MPDTQAIQDLRDRLASQRATLQHHLRQKAIHGSAYVPPAVEFGIREARKDIQSIKAALLRMGASIDAHPDDGDAPAPAESGRNAASSGEQRGSAVRDLRLRRLRQELDALEEEHRAIVDQLLIELNAANRIRLERQLSSLEQQMQQLEQQL